MHFRDIYDFASRTYDAPIIPVVALAEHVKSQSDIAEIHFTKAPLDPNIALGYMRLDKDRSSAYEDPFRIVNVRYHEGLNRCWRRYVCCKELMHVFDTEAERTNSHEKFLRLMKELETPPLAADVSPMLSSEYNTMWMALAALCPQGLRNQYRAKWQKDLLTDYDVALAFRVPEVFIKSLMSDYYDTALETLLAR